MQDTARKCQHLYRLRGHLIEELRALKENLQETELKGFDNPIETVHVIKSLQETLRVVDAELGKCPPED